MKKITNEQLHRAEMVKRNLQDEIIYQNKVNRLKVAAYHEILLAIKEVDEYEEDVSKYRVSLVKDIKDNVNRSIARLREKHNQKVKCRLLSNYVTPTQRLPITKRRCHYWNPTNFTCGHDFGPVYCGKNGNSEPSGHCPYSKPKKTKE